MSFSAGFLDWLKTATNRVVLAEVSVKSGSEIVRYLSDKGYSSHPSDSPPSVLYEGRILGGTSFSRQLNVTDSGGGSMSWGEIELDNGDGLLDSWLNDIWALRDISLFMGAPDAARSTFVKVFSGTVEDISVKGRTRLVLKLRDVLAPLNVPVSTTTIGGTGDQKDVIVPVTLGEVFNVTPKLKSSTGPQVYIVHTGQVEDILEVRDNGYPTAFTKSLSTGEFTLTNQRFGQITCDVQGAKIGGDYRNDVGGIVEFLATELGTTNKLTSGDLDTANFSAFRAANPQIVGIWLSDKANRLQTMQQVAASIGATITCSAEGKVRITKLISPETGTPIKEFTQSDMGHNSFAPTTRPPIKGSVKLLAGKNWTPQATSSLASALTQASLSILNEPYTSFLAVDSVIQSDYNQIDADTAAIETLLVVDGDADAEATRRLAMWNTPRIVIGFDTWLEHIDTELGDCVTVTHPLLGFSSGKPGIVTGIATDLIRGKINFEVLT